MELHEAIRRRAMVRSFSPYPVDPAELERIVRAALRSPTAGNTGGTAWIMLEGPEQTQAYWDAATDEAWRRYSRRWDGLRRAPVILLSYASPEAYVALYAEDDKARTGLGDGIGAWPVPYWFGDAAFGVMAVLLGAVDAGLGACILGAFRGEEDLAQALGVPAGWLFFCAVAIGWPDDGDRPSPSLDRTRPALASRIHRAHW